MVRSMLYELRRLRKSRKLTQKDIAKMLGISPQLYSFIEREKVRLTYDRAIQIANIFGTTPDQIFLSDLSNAIRKPTSTDLATGR